MRYRLWSSASQPFAPVLTEFIEYQFSRQTWWLKTGWEQRLLTALDLLQSTIHNPSPATLGGRGAIQRITLKERDTVVVRHYYRGGLIRHFLRDLYWDQPPRPLAELICLETALRRGVPTVEVLGAGVTWTPIGLYRGTLVTREATGFLNCWEWLCTKPTGEERQKVITAVAQAIARMHDEGIAHADLNLTNILVQATTASPVALLIDFDRAHIFPSPLPRAWRERNLSRLRRSLAKLDPNRLLTSPADLELFCRGYQPSTNVSLPGCRP